MQERKNQSDEQKKKKGKRVKRVEEEEEETKAITGRRSRQWPSKMNSRKLRPGLGGDAVSRLSSPQTHLTRDIRDSTAENNSVFKEES